MSSLRYFIYKGFGERSTQELNHSQATNGWGRTTEEYPEDLGAKVDQTFNNIEHALKKPSGTGLDQVYKLRCYITGPLEDYVEHIVRNMKGRFKNNGPLLTCVQVVRLYKT